MARDRLRLSQLPAGARVGTGSPRRAAQLRALARGLEVEPIRGNVDTRLGLVAQGRLDAVVLALAGLRRIGQEDAVTEVIDPAIMLPAPAQRLRWRSAAAASSHRTRSRSSTTNSAGVAGRVAAAPGRRSAPIGVLGEFVPAGCRSAAGSVTALDGSRTIRRTVTGAPRKPSWWGDWPLGWKQGAAKIR